MKTAIVSGANGFIGRALVKKLISENVEILALDRDYKEEFTQKKIIYMPMDLSTILSLNTRIEKDKYEIFYHLAWAGSAGKDRFNTRIQLNNAQWTIDSLHLAKDIGCKKFVSAGSIMEHETISAALTQGNKPGLGYIYGSGKLVAHTMSKSIASEINIDLIWTYITNAYGPGELSPRFINTTLRKVINDEPLKFTAATQNYDFVYIDDVATAFYLIGKNGKPFHDYLIGSGNARPLKEFINELHSVIKPKQELMFGDVPFTGINLPIEIFDSTQTENDTGFKSQISFSEGVLRTYDWLMGVEKGQNDKEF